MSLGDCPECWDATCSCGYMYRHWTNEAIRNQIEMLNKILSERPSGWKPPPYSHAGENRRVGK